MKKVEEKLSDVELLFNYVEKRNLTKLKQLIKNGVDVNLTYKNSTALIIANDYCNEKIEIVEALVNAGANLDAQDDYKYTALISAIFSKNYKSANFLIKSGANVNIENNNKITALFRCVSQDDEISNDKFEVIKNLIAAGADVNFSTGRYSILMIALQHHLPIA